MKNQLDPNILRDSLTKEIQQKLKKIELNVLTKNTEDIQKDIQILIMVTDELDDVLLNWTEGPIGAISFQNPASDDDDDM